MLHVFFVVISYWSWKKVSAQQYVLCIMFIIHPISLESNEINEICMLHVFFCHDILIECLKKVSQQYAFYILKWL
mgnify:FL=1